MADINKRPEILRLLDTVRQNEREACAKLVERHHADGKAMTHHEICAAIRARKNDNPKPKPTEDDADRNPVR
jgi:hypothetical protein